MRVYFNFGRIARKILLDSNFARVIFLTTFLHMGGITCVNLFFLKICPTCDIDWIHKSRFSFLGFLLRMKLIFSIIPLLHLLSIIILQAFSKQNAPDFAISFYVRMLGHEKKSNRFTFPSLICTCAHLSFVLEGIQIHSRV